METGRKNSVYILPAEQRTGPVALNWGPWAVKKYQSIWMTAHRFNILNAPSRASFVRDFCGAISLDEFRTTPWQFVPGKETINLKAFADVSARPLEFFRFSHLSALPLRPRLFFSHLRICPLCIKAGYHTVLTSLRAMQRCPIHEIGLEDTCDCGKPLLEGFNLLSFGRRQICSCGESFLSHDAAINPEINDTKIEVFSDLANWLLTCGSGVYFSEGADALHADAACFWSDEHHLSKPFVFRNSRDHEYIVSVHRSTRWLGCERLPSSIDNIPLVPDSKRWHFKRLTIQSHLANPLGSIFSSICRYIRRHVLPKMDAWSMLPSFVTHRWSYYGGKHAIPPLMAAYVQYQYFGGKHYFERVPIRSSEHFPYENRNPWPKPVPILKSPFDSSSLLLSGDFFSLYSDGATWLRERAAADIMWTTWKLCVDLQLKAAADQKNRLDFRLEEDPVPVKHWSAAYIDGQYVLRSAALKVTGAPVRPHRALTKMQRAAEISTNKKSNTHRKLQEIGQGVYRLQEDGSWAVFPPLSPDSRAVARHWLQKKKLHLNSVNAVHFYLYPSSLGIVARSVSPSIEVHALNSYDAIKQLKVQVGFFLTAHPLT